MQAAQNAQRMCRALNKCTLIAQSCLRLVVPTRTAISVMQLVRECDGVSKRPLEDVFHADEQAALEATCRQLEGKTTKQKNPHPKGSLAFAAWVCARLGGWTGYYGGSV